MEAIKVGDNFLIHVNIKKAKNVFGFVTSLNFPVDALEINLNTGQPDVVMGKFLGDKATILAIASLVVSRQALTVMTRKSLFRGLRSCDRRIYQATFLSIFVLQECLRVTENA